MRYADDDDDVSERYEYTQPDHLAFIEDMDEAGLEVQHYRGRFFWEGPAVPVDDLQDALSATKVPCQWDNLGLGWIVYPKAYGEVRRLDADAEAP